MVTRYRGSWLAIGAAITFTLPGVGFSLFQMPAPDMLLALVFGIAIVAAAFLLSWAAEVGQLDFSQGLALALLALIAVLPEYVVDASFAWLAAEDPAYAGYAIANMTGANRLLIGIAWPMVLLISALRFRKTSVDLEQDHGIAVVVLLAATAYAFCIAAKGTLTIIDLAVLFGIFAFYMVRIASLPAESPHLVGPARAIAATRPLVRRLIALALTVSVAGAILLVAKPFAKALVASGVSLGIDEFLLVQWLAPMASEAPEFVVVALFAWRGLSGPALGTLISSKVNQWTLLVAMLPLVYSIALGRIDALPLDGRQREEVFLTATQSLFAIALLLDLRLSITGAGVLFGLFMLQLVYPESRMLVAWIYLALTPLVLLISRRHVMNAFRWLRPVPAHIHVQREEHRVS